MGPARASKAIAPYSISSALVKNWKTSSVDSTSISMKEEYGFLVFVDTVNS